MAKILITGHKGFVGRHFVKYFEEKGDQVVGVDIKEGLDCRDFFKSCYEKFDLVIHLAAIVGGREMIENEPTGQLELVKRKLYIIALQPLIQLSIKRKIQK